MVSVGPSDDVEVGVGARVVMEGEGGIDGVRAGQFGEMAAGEVVDGGPQGDGASVAGEALVGVGDGAGRDNLGLGSDDLVAVPVEDRDVGRPVDDPEQTGLVDVAAGGSFGADVRFVEGGPSDGGPGGEGDGAGGDGSDGAAFGVLLDPD